MFRGGVVGSSGSGCHGISSTKDIFWKTHRMSRVIVSMIDGRVFGSHRRNTGTPLLQ